VSDAGQWQDPAVMSAPTKPDTTAVDRPAHGSDTEPQFRRTQMAAPSQRWPIGARPSGAGSTAAAMCNMQVLRPIQPRDMARLHANPLANLPNEDIEAVNQCPLHRR